MPNHRVNFYWSSSALNEVLLNDHELEVSKTPQRLRHLRKTITRREDFLGQGGIYEHETLEPFNLDLKY